ncbi:MAG: hypothetical protein A2X59_08375 [Nitrospirae bacterium GWC2_42_7]|nr:MAG: hypothetical protein A2X59_08375 [Nitrospirae bacterium GWC2_42_7]
MKEKLLFVTKGGDNLEEGFSYAIDLAKTLDAGIVILMIFEKQMNSDFEDSMAAAAFAEAGEFRTAQEILHEQEKETTRIAEKAFRELSEKYKEISKDLTYHIAFSDIHSSIKDFLKNMSSVDMVLISPSLTVNKGVIDVKKLLKNISKPIVTISRPEQASA